MANKVPQEVIDQIRTVKVSLSMVDFIVGGPETLKTAMINASKLADLSIAEFQRVINSNTGRLLGVLAFAELYPAIEKIKEARGRMFFPVVWGDQTTLKAGKELTVNLLDTIERALVAFQKYPIDFGDSSFWVGFKKILGDIYHLPGNVFKLVKLAAVGFIGYAIFKMVKKDK